jgi:hypothetical protein
MDINLDGSWLATVQQLSGEDEIMIRCPAIAGIVRQCGCKPLVDGVDVVANAKPCGVIEIIQAIPDESLEASQQIIRDQGMALFLSLLNL